MFAHSIKNPDIKHYFIYGGHSGIKPETRKPMRYRRLEYLCMQASNTTPSKRTRDASSVTCRNCIRELRRRGIL